MSEKVIAGVDLDALERHLSESADSNWSLDLLTLGALIAELREKRLSLTNHIALTEAKSRSIRDLTAELRAARAVVAQADYLSDFVATFCGDTGWPINLDRLKEQATAALTRYQALRDAYDRLTGERQ